MSEHRKTRPAATAAPYRSDINKDSDLCEDKHVNMLSALHD